MIARSPAELLIAGALYSSKPVAPSLPVVVARRVRVREPEPRNVEGLRDFQAEGVRWLAPLDRALLADEMGLGKTVQALRALERRARVIIVCPSGVRAVWEAECARWRPDLDPRLGRVEPSDLPRDAELVVCSYDSLPEMLDPKSPRTSRLLDADLSEVTVLFDEAHRVKNPEAARTQRARALARQAGAVWTLTGTPLPDRPMDLWGVLKTGRLERRAFGGWSGFVEAFSGKKGRYGMLFGEPTPAAREALARVMLRRTKAQVLGELPEKTYQTLQVPVEDGDLKAALDAVGVEWSDREELPPFELLSAVRAALAAARTSHVLEWVEDREAEGEPVVVFSAHRAPLQALASRPGWGAIPLFQGDGERARARLVRRFQDGELRGLACSIEAAGVGITLTRASRALFVDLSWTPGDNAQAEDRLARIGQRSAVTITRMVARHPVDERLMELLSAKESLIERVVGP